jgi:hypothetical protein
VLVGLDRLFTNVLNRRVIYDWPSGVGNATPGLFILSPVLIAGLLGYIFFWKDDPPSAGLFMLLILGEIFIVAHHQTVQTRYATTIIPFLFYPLGYVLDWAWKRRFWSRCAFSVALALTVAWSLLRVSYATAHYYGHPPDRMFPFLRELPAYLFFYGMLFLIVLAVYAGSRARSASKGTPGS